MYVYARLFLLAPPAPTQWLGRLRIVFPDCCLLASASSLRPSTNPIDTS